MSLSGESYPLLKNHPLNTTGCEYRTPSQYRTGLTVWRETPQAGRKHPSIDSPASPETVPFLPVGLSLSWSTANLAYRACRLMHSLSQRLGSNRNLG
eukprot:768813-Hanusia_phi.AAC.11